MTISDMRRLLLFAWASTLLWTRSPAAFADSLRLPFSLSGAEQASADSLQPRVANVSGDVAFVSLAANLVSTDRNGGLADVFIFRSASNRVELVSVSTNGTSGNGSSWLSSVSADGGVVLFVSSASDLVQGDTNKVADIFTRDLSLGTTRMLQINGRGGLGAELTGQPVLSPDGTKVALATGMDQLVGSDTNNAVDLYVIDLVVGTVHRLSDDPIANGGAPSHRSAIENITFRADGNGVFWTEIDHLGSSGEVPGGRLAPDGVLVQSPLGSPTRRLGRLILDDPSARFDRACAMSPMFDNMAILSLPTPSSPRGMLFHLTLDSGAVESVEVPSALGSQLGRQGRFGSEFRGPLLGSKGKVVFIEGFTVGPDSITNRTIYRWDVELRSLTPMTNILAAALNATRVTANTFGGLDLVTTSGEGTLLVAAEPISTDDEGDEQKLLLFGPSDWVARPLPSKDTRGRRSPTRWTEVSLTTDGSTMAFAGTEPGDGVSRVGSAWQVYRYLRESDRLECLSTSAAFSATGTMIPFDPNLRVVSDAGRVAYTVVGRSTTSNGTEAAFDVFVGATSDGSGQFLTSQLSTPAMGNRVFLQPSLSMDGRFIAFTSALAGVVPGDTNDLEDVFLRDFVTGQTWLVSRTEAGTAPSLGRSGHPWVSSSGRYVAFESESAELVAGDTNNVPDVFLFDRNDATVRLVSRRATLGILGNLPSGQPAITPDEQFVVFESRARNLGPADTRNGRRIYAKRIADGTMLLLSPAGTLGAFPGPGPCARFDSSGSVVGLTQFSSGRRPRMSVLRALPSNTEVLTLADAVISDISADGSRIAYARYKTNGAGGFEALVIDRQSGASTSLSQSETGSPANASCSWPALNRAGTKAVFSSSASNLVAGDTNGVSDVFLRDLVSGRLLRIGGNGWSGSPVFGGSEQSVLFISDASDLVADDLNGRPDLFEAFVDGAGSQPKVRLIRRPGDTNVTLLWDYSLGARYRVESQGSLGLPWEPMVEAPLIRDGQVSVVIEASPDTPSRFFRIRQD